MTELIKPEEFKVTDKDGKERTYILSHFDAVEGRRIVSQYPMTGMPKIGDYEENEKLLFRLMGYVAVSINGQQIRLSTPELVRNHVPDFETLISIEMKMMAINCSFFQNGRSLDFFDNLTQLFAKKISEMLMLSSAQLSPTEKQHSTN